MKSIAISGSLRENVGKRDAKELRYEGRVPCVLYGGDTQVHFAAFASDLKNLVYTPDALFVNLDIEGKKYQAVMQDLQFHPVTDLVLHIDFMEMFPDKMLVMDLPVKLTGVSPGVKVGGKLIQKQKRLKVKGLPKNFTDTVEVNIDQLELGKAIRVGDITLKNLEIINSKADTIVTVASSRALKEAETAAKK